MLFIWIPGSFNKYFIAVKIARKSKINKYAWHIECQVLLSGSIEYIQKKGNIIENVQKVEETKTKVMIDVRVHLMGYWEGGHMTNFPKWSKTKVVALHCSFQNLFESCSKVLLLWRYEVEHFEKCRVFFCFLHFSP